MRRKTFASYQPTHTEQQLRAMVTRVLRSDGQHLQRVEYGVINVVCFARLATGADWVIKVAPQD
ncbi:MAG: hypothetical protein ACR2PL_16135 [Dehalococcoidia bacterium]